MHALDLAADPLHFGAALVALGEAEGCVAGAACPTGDVVRAALWAIGTAPGVSLVSSSFYMVLPDDTVLTFTDCAVVPEPTPGQLAEIALAAARDRSKLVGDSPRVAFLSYSTKGSAGGPHVARVQEAAARFQQLAPNIDSDGELQADAALSPEVGERKAPGSPVAGRANVLVFPDLDAGNIGYKLVQRLARRGGHRSHSSGSGPPHGRPVAGGHPRRYCRGGGDGRVCNPMVHQLEGVTRWASARPKAPAGSTVVEVDGQLIVGNRHELKDLIQVALERGERRLLVDFSRTGYIDSSGLGALVSDLQADT